MSTHEPRICEVCSTSFLPPYAVTAAYWAGRTYCSPQCSNKGRKGQPSTNKGRVLVPFVERFWSKVDQRGSDECWEWQGAVQVSGYGYLHGGAGAGRRWVLAHRTSWILHFGEIPEGLLVCHHCDNPPCCNPHHLFLGTRADNNHDRRNKGRSHSVLSEAGVREIKRRLALKQPQADIAARFNVAHQTISDIARGKRWSHIS